MHEWTEEQIMTVLQEQGILLNKYDDKKRNRILVCCPFHNDKNPSMDISLTKGVVHCFAGCFGGTFTQFVYKLLGGVNPKSTEYIRRFQKEDDFKFEKLPRRECKTKIEIPKWDDLEVAENELAKYDHTDWTYSKQRGISESVCREFRLGMDYERGSVTFPLKIGGKYIAICRRNINKKRFHVPTELEGRRPLAYLDEAVALAQHNNISKIVIVESCYNALTCYTHGIPAVATLGEPTEQQAEILKQTDIKEVLIACDGDNAGHKFTLKWKSWLKDKKKTTEILLPDNKDVNDLVQDDPSGQKFNEIIGKIYWGE